MRSKPGDAEVPASRTPEGQRSVLPALPFLSTGGRVNTVRGVALARVEILEGRISDEKRRLVDALTARAHALTAVHMGGLGSGRAVERVKTG